MLTLRRRHVTVDRVRILAFPERRGQGGRPMHRMDAEFDTGLILVERAVETAPDDDIDSFFPKLLAIGGPMIPEMLQAVAAGASGTPQPIEGTSYAPLCTDADRWLDWTRPAAQLRNQVRGWGSQGALASIDGQTYLVFERVLLLPPQLHN